MNEQTKIELLKIAANLTNAYAGSGTNEHNVKVHFEHFCFYLFENFDKFGDIKEITLPESDYMSLNEHSLPLSE